MNGIEIYSNAFGKDYCNAVIAQFEQMSRNQKTTLQSGIHKNNDERVTFDWAPTGNMFYQNQDLCQHF